MHRKTIYGKVNMKDKNYYEFTIAIYTQHNTYTLYINVGGEENRQNVTSDYS